MYTNLGRSLHTDPCQFERLFRAIYRPQNTYCIHIDRKSDPSIHRAIRAITQCFPNTFMEYNYEIVWGSPSILHSILGCMKDLVASSRSWKYYMNLAGQEFPLKTNLQLVRILKLLNGANLIDGSEKQYGILNNAFRVWKMIFGG